MKLVVLLAVIATACARVSGEGLNVRDFGAKGDGVSDDTAAFNAAGAAMLKQAMSGATIWGFRNRGERSGSVEEPRPALFVPKGRYLIKGTIVMSRDVYVRGEDGTELVGESPTNDIFYVAAAYRTRIENLSFVGGRHQFRPETFNTESANIRILNCRFRDSAAAAVHSLSYKVKGERWGCGAWKYDRKTCEFSPNTNYVPEKLVANNHSTMFVIDGCRFDRCATAVRMYPDGSVVRNSEFIMAPGETNAALKVSNEMHGYNLKFSHYAGSAAIETAGSLKLWLENSSVTTPDRSGARVLRGNLCSSGSVASELVMQDVRTDAGLAQGVAICDFRDAFPAYAALVRVTAEGPNEVKAFSFKPQEDFAAFDKSRRIKAWEPDRFFSYGLRDCSANIVWRDGYAKRFERPIPDWAAGKIVGCTVDHSTAGEKKVFEPKWHEIGDTFVIDRDMTFDADGVAAFRGMPADKPWFVVKKGARAVLRNLQMRGGRNFVVVEPGGEAFVDSCFSYDCEEAAFKCEKGGRLEVDCGVYYAARLYEGEGDAALRSIWYRYTGVVPPDAPIPPFAAIVNRGRLVAHDVLGVPTVFDRFPHDVSQAMAEPTTRYDLRWVDNYGDYSSRMFRYGGEWGGVPAVFHFGAAKTLVEGGYAWYWNRSVADAMVVSDSPDGDIKVFGVVFAQYRQYLKRIELHWRDSSGSDHPIANPQMHFTCPTPEPRPATSEALEGSKPDYVVYRPLQPRGGKNADPTKRGDCYNDHFQVIWDDARKLYYAFWTQGSGEGYGDMHVCLSKSADRGRTWTYPKLIAGGEKIAEPKPRAVWQQPMLSKGGRLYCLWNQQVNDEKLHHGVVYGAYSDDAGETWSKPERNDSIPRQFRDDWKGVSLPSWCNWQRPLRLAEGGKFLVACTRHGTGRGEPHRSLAIEFWRFENIDENPEIRDIKITVLSGGKDAIRVPAGDTGRFICEEAGIVKLPDGRLFALMRTRNRHPYWVQSSDGGVSWSKPEPLRDAKGEAYLHPCSPCPIYDVNGCEAASGEYVAFIHNAYDDSIPPLGRQPRGPVYMIRGRFDPKSAQPIVFGTPELFSPVKNGNSYYASFTCADGEGVLWFAHQKHFLIGRKIDSVGKGAAAAPVWIRGAEKEMNAFYGFSAAFDVKAGERPVLRLSAGAIARVWVNGMFAGYGPARAPEGYIRFDEWPLADFVKEGRNVIAIEVSNPAVNTFYLPEQSGFLLAEVVSGGRTLAATGRDFKAIRLPRVAKTSRFSYQREFAEFYSVAPESYGWHTNGIAGAGLVLESVPMPKSLGRGAPYPTFEFDGTFHPTARTVLKRDPRRKAKEIRHIDKTGNGRLKGFPKESLEVNFSDAIQQLAAERIEPVSAEAGAAIRLKGLEGVVFEGAKNTAGFPRIEVQCVSPATIWLVMDELAGPDGLPNPVRFHSCVNACGWRLEKPGRYTLECFQPYGLKCAHVIVEGGEAEIVGFDVRTYLNPDAARASFRCSDAALGKVFSAAAQSLACNAVDVFTDCPGRERGAYFGDTVFTARGANVLLGGTAMERTQFENYALAPKFDGVPEGIMPMLYPGDTVLGEAHWIPNFCMWTVIQLADYVRRGGDASMAAALRPKAEGVLAWFRRSRNAEGLLENLPGWVFIEWSDAARFTKGVNYPTNMLYVRFLDAFAELYGEAGCRDEAASLRNKIRSLSWNGEWFRDHSVRGANGSLETPDDCTEVCQYLAFFSGVATPRENPELWRRLVEEMGPMRKADAHSAIHRSNMLFGYSLRFVMLSEAGLSARVLKEVGHCYLPMAEKTGTLWEAVSADGYSCCHGFPCLAAWLIVRDALGIKSIDRKSKTVEISPAADLPLDWCEGSVPLSTSETMTVKWRKDGERPSVQVDMPPGWKRL